MQFGDRLRKLRSERKLRQEDLAKVLNVHRATVGKYETGERFPDKETLQFLAEYFCVSLDYLLGRINIKNPYSMDDTNQLLKEKEAGMVVKDPQYIDISGLPPDAVRQICEYVDFIKQKYSHSSNSKQK